MESRNFCNKAGPSISPLYVATYTPPPRTTGLLDRRDERAALLRGAGTTVRSPIRTSECSKGIPSDLSLYLLFFFIYLSLLATSRVIFL